MSDLFKKFKSVFIAEGPADANQPAPADFVSNKKPEPAVSPSLPEPPAPATGAVTDKFSSILLSALEKNNQTGFDYFEFRQALANLAKMSMDERTRFQSAFAMAQTMGVTPAALVESAKFYLNVLQGEQANFNEAHQQQRAKLIGNREEEAQKLEAMMAEKAAQIDQLNQQIEAHRQQAEQIRKEVSESTIKIENTRADFEATFASVVGQMQTDISKMQQYLQ